MKYSLILFLSLANSIISLGQNVLISKTNEPNEPCIVINPKQPNVILAGANINNYYMSKDTGRTWKVGRLSSSYGVWGDPILAVDTSNNFYFFHLSNPKTGGSWIDRIVCQKTNDNGATWTNGTYTGLNGVKNQDKESVIIDRKTNDMYVTWTQFDVYGVSDPNIYSNILFSKSTDGGNSWSQAIRLNTVSGDCIDSDDTVEGATPAIGPNGELYVSWAGPEGILLTKSLDKGETWLDSEIKIDDMPTGWDYKIPGIDRSNGLPIMHCDLSNGPHRGTLYINWSDQRNGSDNTDIWLSKSTDGGLTWQGPYRVNDDESQRHQFFTYMTIDQVTGFLYFVFYDRRHTVGNATDVYMAISKDGGQTFINSLISESSFIPNEDIFFGDYTSITSYNNIVRPIWTRLQNGELSIWTNITPIDKIVSKINDTSIENFKAPFENYPNPSKEQVFISYKLRKKSTVKLSMLDLDGKPIFTFIKDEMKESGKYIESIDLQKYNLKTGTYLIVLEIDGKIHTEKQAVIK